MEKKIDLTVDVPCYITMTPRNCEMIDFSISSETLEEDFHLWLDKEQATKIRDSLSEVIDCLD